MAGFSIGSLFRPVQQGQQPQQQQPQQPPQGAPGSSMQLQNPGADPSQQPQGTPQQPPSSPLDQFKDLWKDAGNNGASSADPFASPLFNTDPAKIVEAAGKADFLSQVPQELIQKAMSGNDPQAFMQIINAVGQQALAMSLQLSTATTEQAGQRIGERFNKALPERFKDMQLGQMPATNPVLNHPAAEPMLRNLRDQVRRQEPNLRPDEVNAKAEQYLMSFASTLVGNNSGGGQGQQGGQQEQDWEAWVSK